MGLGIPFELITMLGSGLLGGIMTLWGMKLKAELQRQDYMLKAAQLRNKAVDKARQVNTPEFSFTRRTIAISAVLAIIVLPKLAALFFPDTPVLVGYTEFNPGFWFFTDGREVIKWQPAAGFVITPLDTHLVSAITGLYFGASIVRKV